MVRAWVFLLAFASAGLAPAPGLRAQDTAASRRAAIEAMFPAMLRALESGNFGQARNICDQAIAWEPQNPVHYYQLACIETRAGAARRAQAFHALQRSAELGFDDVATLESDPHLVALHNTVEFAEILRHVRNNARNAANSASPVNAPPADPREANGPTRMLPPRAAALRLPAASAGRAMDLVALADVEPPAPASFRNGAPVGLYFMTRLWPFTHTLEKLVWYFAPNGTVYQSLEYGFSRHDLASHAGPKGRVEFTAGMLTVRWLDGKMSSGAIEQNADEPGAFSWDGGNFVPARPFARDGSVAGSYEGDESISFSGNRAALSRTLELRADGTFRWRGVSFLSSTTEVSHVIAASNGVDSTGRWHASGYVIVLVDEQGKIYRRIAFPWDDPTTPVRPDHLVFGGTFFQRR